METSSSLQDSIRPIQIKSRRLLKSQPPRFLVLFFLVTFPPAATTILSLIFLFSPLLDTNYSVYYDQQGHDHDHVVIPSLTTTILVAISCFLFNLIFSSFAVGSITFSVFHAFQGRQVDLTSLFSSLATSFLPVLSTTLPLQTITIAMFSFISFSIVAVFGMLVGFRNLDLGSPHFMPILTVFLIGVTYIVARVQADWSLATTIAALELDKWGFKSLKLSKSLIKRSSKMIGYRISFEYGLSQGPVAIITCFLCLILIGTQRFIVNESKNLVFLIGAVVLMTSIYMSWFQIYHIATNTVFYVQCKASTEVGLLRAKEYVKLGCEDDKNNNVGVVGVDSLV